jgi:type I restriction enzyme S subunit
MSNALTHIDNKKQLVPVSRFKEFNDDWKTVTLFDLSENVSYGMNAAAIAFDGVHKYLRITDIDEDSGTFKPRPLTSPEGKISEKFKLQKNDIVFTRTGASVGKPYLYNEKDGDLYYAGFLIKFSLTKGDSYFIYSLTQKEAYNKWVHVYSMRSGQPGLNAEEYKALKLTIPSLPEQQKIASFLSAVDEKIQQLTKKKALLKQYKKGVMHELFSGQLRFKDEKGKDYPDWEEKRLLEFCTFFSGGTPSSTNKKFYSGTIPFIGSGNIYDSEVFNFITEEALNSSSAKIVEEGDLLYALYGANSGEVAISQIEGAINQAILCIRTKESIEYLYYVLLGNKDNIVAKYLQGGQGNLSAQIIKKLKYNFPSQSEQQKIATYLSRIDTKLEAVNSQITQSQSFKKGLLQQMFV